MLVLLLLGGLLSPLLSRGLFFFALGTVTTSNELIVSSDVTTFDGMSLMMSPPLVDFH